MREFSIYSNFIHIYSSFSRFACVHSPCKPAKPITFAARHNIASYATLVSLLCIIRSHLHAYLQRQNLFSRTIYAWWNASESNPLYRPSVLSKCRKMRSIPSTIKQCDSSSMVQTITLTHLCCLGRHFVFFFPFSLYFILSSFVLAFRCSVYQTYI